MVRLRLRYLVQKNKLTMTTQLNEVQKKMIHTSLTYMCANSDDHGMYYLWSALGMGSREDNELTEAEIERNDKRCEDLLQDCIKIFQ